LPCLASQSLSKPYDMTQEALCLFCSLWYWNGIYAGCASHMSRKHPRRRHSCVSALPPSTLPPTPAPRSPTRCHSYSKCTHQSFRALHSVNTRQFNVKRSKSSSPLIEESRASFPDPSLERVVPQQCIVPQKSIILQERTSSLPHVLVMEKTFNLPVYTQVTVAETLTLFTQVCHESLPQGATFLNAVQLP